MVVRLTEHPDGIVVHLDGREIELSWTWLRDHALDAESFLDSAKQRIVRPATVAAAGPGRATVDGDGIEVAWPGGPSTVFREAFLASLVDPSAAVTVGATARPWTATDGADRLLELSHERFVGDTDGLRCAIDHVWRDGVVTLRSVPLDTSATLAVLERIGYVRTTIFGDLWEFRSDGGFDDTASTPLEITPHTDGTYSHDAPGLLGLHCLAYDAQGGENVFVDGHSIVERLSPTSREVLSTIEIPGRYIGDGAHLMAKRPVLRFDGSRLVQISYNHHDRAPFVLPEPSMSEVYDALFEFDALANDPDLQIDVELRPGDMVIFDNWRLLHGRRAFTGERLIAGGYVNREDLESTTRLANA